MMEPEIEPTTSDLELLASVLADDMEGVEDAVEKDAAEEDAQAGEEDAQGGEEDAQAGVEDADDAEEEEEDADDDEEEEEDAAEEVEKTLILPPTRRRAPTPPPPSPQQHRKRKVQHCDRIPSTSKKARRRNLPRIPISAIWGEITKFNNTNEEMRRDYLKSFEFNDDTIDEEAILSLQLALHDTTRKICAIARVFQDTRDVKTFGKKDLMRSIDNALMQLVLKNISPEEIDNVIKRIIKEYNLEKGRSTLTDEE